MPRLLHHRLDPASRLARLMFAEYGVAVDLEDIKPWARDAHLLELNPAGTVPILLDEAQPNAVGVLSVIHAIEDRYSPAAVAGLFPALPKDRTEMC
jgi:glutathione S-transferase